MTTAVILTGHGAQRPGMAGVLGYDLAEECVLDFAYVSTSPAPSTHRSWNRRPVASSRLLTASPGGSRRPGVIPNVTGVIGRRALPTVEFQLASSPGSAQTAFEW
jgi:hypothetical protein